MSILCWQVHHNVSEWQPKGCLKYHLIWFLHLSIWHETNNFSEVVQSEATKPVKLSKLAAMEVGSSKSLKTINANSNLHAFFTASLLPIFVVPSHTAFMTPTLWNGFTHVRQKMTVEKSSQLSSTMYNFHNSSDIFGQICNNNNNDFSDVWMCSISFRFNTH